MGIEPVSPLARVQFGTLSIDSPQDSGTATITSVNTGKSMLLLLGFTGDANGSLSNTYPRITLTNATTITGNRFGTAGGITVSFVVLEFK